MKVKNSADHTLSPSFISLFMYLFASMFRTPSQHAVLQRGQQTSSKSERGEGKVNHQLMTSYDALQKRRPADVVSCLAKIVKLTVVVLAFLWEMQRLCLRERDRKKERNSRGSMSAWLFATVSCWRG